MNRIALNLQVKLRKLMTLAMVALLGASSMPVQLVLAAEPPRKAHARPAKKNAHPVKRKTSAELTKPVIRQLVFSAEPSDLEIFNARVFPEPLVPMNDKVAASENKALAQALLSFKNRKNPEDVSALTQFLQAHPGSRWEASLEGNLGKNRFDYGYLTDALKYLQSAWELSKSENNRERKAAADQAFSNLVLLEARLGHMKELEEHLLQVKGRVLTGSVEDKVRASRNGLWGMKNHPERSFRCGPFALQSIAGLYPGKKFSECKKKLTKANSTQHGTNLAQLQDWADETGLDMQMAKRSDNKAKVVVPSVMHWKEGHFAAVLAEEHGRYKIQDPTFDNSSIRWISSQALASETDGYYLVPKGKLPDGWQKVNREEAQGVWGRGLAYNQDNGKGQGAGHSGGCGANSCCGMPHASAFSMNATLNIQDTPLSSNPPLGPDPSIFVNYNYLESNQPGTFGFTNLGADWSLNWVAYLTVDGSQNITVNPPGGGSEIFTYQSSSQPYLPDMLCQAQMIVLGGGGGYQRQLVDGTVENYTLNDGSYWLLTSVTDPQGNALTISWDMTNFRINSITDASGNTSTFSYLSDSPTGTNEYYKLASVTDAWGRSATFGYDSTNTFLTSITDAAGNESTFSYDTDSSLITMMTTPYGSTSFYQYTPQGGSPTYLPTGLRFTYPDGTSEVIENWLDYTRETYYWNREAMSLYPNDPGNLNYSHCKSTRWLLESWSGSESPIPIWTRKALEAPVTYTYPGNNPDDVDLDTATNAPIGISRQISGYKETATIGGTVTPSDVLTLSVHDLYFPDNATVSYTVQSGDTLTSIATQVAAAINSSGVCQAFGLTATSAAEVVTITSQSIGDTYLSDSSSGSPTETITCTSGTDGPNPVEKVVVGGGSITGGDVLTISVYDSGLPGGEEDVNYTVQSSDSFISITQSMAQALNSDANLQSAGITAFWTGNDSYESNLPTISIQSNSTNSTTYGTSVSSGATESLAAGPISNGTVQQWAYQRNSLGYVTQSIDPVGRQFNNTYADNEIDLLETRETQGIDNFLVGHWEYNDGSAPHRPTLFIDAAGQETQYSYNAVGQLETVTDANSNVTTLSYDGNGYLTEIDGPLSGSDDVTTFSFFGYGPVNTVTDSEGYELTYAYDGLNRQTSVTYPDGTSEKSIYDKLDLVMQSDRLGRWTKYNYDNMDQLASMVDPLGRATKYCWCICGSLGSLTDAANHTTKWHHDLEGRITEKEYADSTTVDYTYYPSNSWLATKTDALSQVTNFTHNLDNSLQQKWYTDAVNSTSAVVYSYDTVFKRASSISNGWGTYDYGYSTYRMVDLIGSPTTNDYVNVPIYNPALSGVYDFQYQVQSSDTSLATLASSIKSAINADGTLSAAGVTATNSGATVTVSGTGTTIAYPNTNGVVTETLGGTITSGDNVSIIVHDAGIGGDDSQTYTHSVSGGDTLSSVASDLASQITSGVGYLNITATSSGSDVIITSASYNATSYTEDLNDGATITISQSGGPTESALPTVPDNVGNRLASVTNDVVDNSDITFSYDVLGRMTNRSINSSSNSTTWSYDAISRVTSEANPLGTFDYTYVDDSSGSSKGVYRLSSISYPNGQTTNFKWLPNIGDQRLQEISNLNPSSATISQFNYAYDAAGEITQWQQQQNSSNKHFDLGYDLASQLSSAVTDSGSAFSAYISGTPHTGDVVSVTAYDATLSGGTATASYTVAGGDSSADIATGLASAINTAFSSISATASASGQTVSISTSPSYCTQFSCGVSGSGATDTISLSESSPIQDLYSQLYYNYDCAGNRTGVQGDSTGSFPSGLTTTATQYTYNNLNELTGTAAGGPIRFQASTTNPVKSAVVNVTETATVGGSIQAGDVVRVMVHDNSLSHGECIVYTVLSGDTTTTIATALKNAINNDSVLSGLGVSATSSGAVVTISSSSTTKSTYVGSVNTGAMVTLTLNGTVGSTTAISPSDAFTGNPVLASGSNTASVTASSGGGTTTTDTYPITISSATAQSLTYDDNGNMTSDGINSYDWDAENRLIKITYPGSGNNSQFAYDGLGRCVEIVESVSGTPTTLEFVWCGIKRCETRNGTGFGTVVNQFFGMGEVISGTSYYYTQDHLGSTRELVDGSGNTKTRYSYDPYGQATQTFVSGSIASDSQYAGYYYHSASGDCLTRTRAYNASLGRFINRDPISETGGINLYGYVNNDPTTETDPSGFGIPREGSPLRPIGSSGSGDEGDDSCPSWHPPMVLPEPTLDGGGAGLIPPFHPPLFVPPQPTWFQKHILGKPGIPNWKPIEVDPSNPYAPTEKELPRYFHYENQFGQIIFPNENEIKSKKTEWGEVIYPKFTPPHLGLGKGPAESTMERYREMVPSMTGN